MRRYIWLILIVLALAFAYSTAEGQSKLEIKDVPKTATSSAPKQWVLKWENSFNSKLTASNKAEIINRPFVKTSTRFTNYQPNRSIWIETSIGHTVNGANWPNYLLGMDAGIERKFGKYYFAASGEINYTRYYNFGRIGTEAGRFLGEESVTLKPFTRLDYFFPTDNFGESNIRRRVNNGTTWSTGIESYFQTSTFALSNKSQIIVDTGSILPNQRTLFATETVFGLNYGHICFGPKVEYVLRLYGNGWSGMQKNSFNGGFFIRYR